MGDGPPGFRRNFTCSAVLRIHSGEDEVLTTGLLPSLTDLSRSLRLPHPFVTPYRVSYNPKRQASWFGLFPFRSPLLRESRLLSLPQGTKMFQFPWYAPVHPMDSDGGASSSSWRVPPFGHPRINAHLQLPGAYRCSSRPSSAPGAKASTVCP